MHLVSSQVFKLTFISKYMETEMEIDIECVENGDFQDEKFSKNNRGLCRKLNLKNI